MAAAAANAVTIAHILTMKSNMAMPFFHPPVLAEACPGKRGAFPLAMADESAGTSMVVLGALILINLELQSKGEEVLKVVRSKRKVYSEN